MELKIKDVEIPKYGRGYGMAQKVSAIMEEEKRRKEALKKERMESVREKIISSGERVESDMGRIKIPEYSRSYEMMTKAMKIIEEQEQEKQWADKGAEPKKIKGPNLLFGILSIFGIKHGGKSDN